MISYLQQGLFSQKKKGLKKYLNVKNQLFDCPKNSPYAREALEFRQLDNRICSETGIHLSLLLVLRDALRKRSQRDCKQGRDGETRECSESETLQHTMANPDAHRQHNRQHHRSKARPSSSAVRPKPKPRVPLTQLLRVASVAGGIQFGWALQLSLLTPYVQQLGIPHAWASIIWLCGPLSGLLVQPLVGLLSDRCTSRFGRRRPFILGGALAIVVSVLIIGHAADLGWRFGDTKNHRPGAVAFFVFGFWILDVANNVTQGPCRALLGDLTGIFLLLTNIIQNYFS